MRLNLKGIIKILTSPPSNGDGAFTPSGAPFKLPYSLSLPANESNRWRIQRDIILASQMLSERIMNEMPSPAQKTFLNALSVRDVSDLNEIAARILTLTQIEGNTNCNQSVNQGGKESVNIGNRFSEIKDILETSVGSSQIGAHGNFWHNKTRDEFIVMKVFGTPLIVKKADGTFDENESNLVKAMQERNPFGSNTGTPAAIFRRMPADFDPVPPETDFMNRSGMASHDNDPRGFTRAFETIFQPLSIALYPLVLTLHKNILQNIQGLKQPSDTQEFNNGIFALRRLLEMMRASENVGDLSNSGRRGFSFNRFLETAAGEKQKSFYRRIENVKFSLPSPSARLKLSPAAKFESIPSLEGNLIVWRTALKHPALENPVTFVDGILIGNILSQPLAEKKCGGID